MSKVYWAQGEQVEPETLAIVYWARGENLVVTGGSRVYWASATNEDAGTNSLIGEADLPELTTLVIAGGGSVFTGDTLDLTATARDQDGDPIQNLDLTDALVNEDVGVATLTVLADTNADGEATVRATPVAAGTTDVSLLLDGVTSGTETVDVRTLSSAVLSVPQPSLEVGTTGGATATFKDSAGDPIVGSTVTWSSSNDTVIADPSPGTTDSAGSMTVPLPALAEGTTSLQATCEGVATNAVTVSVFVVADPPSYTPVGVSKIVINAESMLMRMNRAQPRRFSDADQRLIDPEDTAFSRVKDNSERPVIWPSRELLIRYM